MLYINIDASYYEFKINEKYYIDASLVVLLKYNQWKTLVNLCNKHYIDEKEEKEKKHKSNDKNSRNKRKIKKNLKKGRIIMNKL